ncbi:MAG: DUF3788 family protein [Betaproteobacteria bacterium]
MTLSAFADRSARPSEADLLRVLDSAAPLWTDLVAHISSRYEPVSEQWHFAGARFGWSMRLRRTDRIVLYLIPQAGTFLAGIVLGAKAVAAAQDEKLPVAVLKLIAEAPRYAEGTGVRLPIASQGDLSAIKKLVALKMA